MDGDLADTHNDTKVQEGRTSAMPAIYLDDPSSGRLAAQRGRIEARPDVALIPHRWLALERERAPPARSMLFDNAPWAKREREDAVQL